MIDTVQYRQPRYLRESASRRNWNIETVMREVIDSDGLEDEQLRRVRGVHKHKGIRFFGNRDQIVSVQASLPRLLFGHNGKLLRSQAEMTAAFRKLNRTLDKISHPPEGSRVFKRIDLVWHVPGRCADFIAAHQKVRHPRVRKATCVYDGESITWRGSAFSLMIYDKAKKQLGQPGEFVRVEVQLRNHMLDEFLGELETELDFTQCYRYFRRLVLQLEPAASFRASSLASLLSACMGGSFGANVINPAETYLQNLCSRRQRDLRREVMAIQAATHSINWSHLLPDEPPTDPPGLEG